ncbi:hypothetical protein JOL79_31795 [Microbispora sp. RL4-1S]|uniref:Uncharacterized protein n=1 Tax=Microbispora oryzae TaxID=2806554 RepID=A0A941AMF9_9ACTN|nr:hypothetical protein [Microbispora oryzae]MBP2708372.1 hypothetical protein [Microbispora oryzae]
MSWLQSGPLPPIWPEDRYEVRSYRSPGDRGTEDRYHLAEQAHEAVVRLRQAGLAMQIQVIRLHDGVTLFDLMAGVDQPIEAW